MSKLSALHRKLGELFKFKNGRAFKKEEWCTKGLPIIRIQNLNNENGSFNYYAGDYSNDILVQDGDLLFSWSGTVGSSFGPHIWRRGKGLLNQHIFAVSFKTEMDKRYAYYALERITEEIELQVSGAVGLVHITKEKLNDFTIPVPPLSEQLRIVGILDEAFEGIAIAKTNAEKNLQNARALFESHLNALFTQRGDGWVEKTLGEVCILRSGTTLPKGIEKSSGEIPYLKVADMNISSNLNGVTCSSRYVDKIDVNISNFIPVGTTIFPKRGGAILTNKKRLTKRVICADLNIMGAIPKSGLLPKFLFYFFLRLDLREINNGSSIPQINNYSIEPILIAFPRSIMEQETIIVKIETLSEEICRLESIYRRKLVALDELKKSLLNQAFTGNL